MNEHSNRLLENLAISFDSYLNGEISLSNLSSVVVSTANALDEPSLAGIRIELEKFDARIELLTSSVEKNEGDTLVQFAIDNLYFAIKHQLVMS